MNRMRPLTFQRRRETRSLAATCAGILITSFFAPCFVSVFVACVAAAPARADTTALPAGDDYGAGLSLGEVSDLEDVVAHPARYEDNAVLVRGRISKVCQHRGCWTVLSVGETILKVNMKDHAFFIPTDSSGRQAYVEGMLEREATAGEGASDSEQHRTGSERCEHEGHEGGEARACKERGDSDDPQGALSLTANGVRLLAAD